MAVTCSSCGADNREGRKFCSRCGAALAMSCRSCGAPNEADDRFCGECGAALVPDDDSAVASTVPSAPVAERRLVSVLFADLVGFTTLSESRDPEEVRELLSRYFDNSRRLIGRYGGTVEKFIGDAVMAVWGAPVANEDDAERAVRAGLDLVAAVAVLGEEVQAPDLALRAGVATGEAAVTLGAEGQGMVAGDLVNTASRIQAVAAPGTVLVTGPTRHATEAAIVYEDAGAHELKGKSEPLALSRAMRVTALVGGQLRSAGLESPFVGRAREFRMLKELFHASAEDRRAHLVSVTGVAGIGKSRLSWEFFKYIDGLADTTWWHRGRCIPYGEGVTYWALAEMVRMRALIVEDESPAAALEKLRMTIANIVPDEEDRTFVEPRLAHLLGLEERTSPSREDLFAGCRLFFERMTDRAPVVMVFEDLQWADESLLDFVEYLLDWSRDHPMFVVALARPELLDRRPTWGAGRHGSTSASLEPLDDSAMDELLRGMVPGLPDDLRARIRDRAEGIPLYAVEIVRMLLDRGLLRRDGDRYEPAADVEELAVPETLQALIAARLDGLPLEERALLQDASILGKMFTPAGVAALAGRSEEDVEPLLRSLVRKELLAIQMDPGSPERGQYGFLQSLVQNVAHDTLSKRDRRIRHLAAADFIERTWSGDEDEIVEVVASHLLEAFRLTREGEDSTAVKVRARDTLARAGRRAQSLAAMQAACGYFERAAELSDDPADQAGLLEQAGLAAYTGTTNLDALALFERSVALFEAAGRTHDAARLSARAGVTIWQQDRPEEAAVRMERALAVLAEEEPDHDLAMLHAELGRVRYFMGDVDEAARQLEAALEIAEGLWLPDVLSEALNSKGLVAFTRGRHEEELGLFMRSLDLALENDVTMSAVRAFNNISFTMMARDRLEEALEYQRQGIAFAERLGFQWAMRFVQAHLGVTLWLRGEWAELGSFGDQMEQADDPSLYRGEFMSFSLMHLAIARGDLDGAESLLDRFIGDPEAGDVQTRAFRHLAHAMLANARGDHRVALEEVRRVLEHTSNLGIRHEVWKPAFVEALEAALATGEIETAEEVRRLVTDAPPGAQTPLLRAQAARFGARIAVAKGVSEEVEPGFKAAAGLLRELGAPFLLAQTLLEHGEWLVGQDQVDEARPILDEATAIFRRLDAAPFLERAERVAPDLALA
jgi:class 3 adenylate cyclase/tetratricopeptide (TPR) repeat protein